MSHDFCIKSIPKKTVIVVAGPTASGKSDWALHYAQKDESPGLEKSGLTSTHTSPLFKHNPISVESHHSGCIINGDSMQLYKGLDILTAMPSSQDQLKVPHHLYGILSPGDTYDVSQWRHHAHQRIAMAHGHHQRAWIVGGSGFYLKTLMDGLSPMPSFEAKDKESLRQEYRDTSMEDLKKLVVTVDPISAEKCVDKQRLLHAWIIYRLSGKSLSWWYRQPRKPSDLTFFKVLIWPSREDILSRAKQRWECMVAQGVYEEVRSFCSHPQWHQSSLSKAIGVVPIHAMLEGRLSAMQCGQHYLIEVAQYIKRQRTWFRQQFQPHYVCDSDHGSITSESLL